MPDAGQPDLIQVQADAQHEVVADRADIHVTIKGSSLVSGQTALRKAREVALLVQELQSHGVNPEDIHLQGVSAEVSGGSVLKSSQATYRLRVRCSDLERLADVVGAITAQKSVSLRAIEWLYPDDETEDVWLASVIRRANDRSAKIAAALGVKLLGVHQLVEHWSSQEEGGETFIQTLGAGETAAVRRRAQVTAEDLGMDIYHTKTVNLRVVVSYRVGGFGTRDSAAS